VPRVGDGGRRIFRRRRHPAGPRPVAADDHDRCRSPADGDRVHLVVAERGTGIAPADLAHIFDPYFTTKRGGTGLGLPITKNIVEGLGGTISVSSAPGQGTEIQLDLPR
jgi:signal transduction histidine kinase